MRIDTFGLEQEFFFKTASGEFIMPPTPLTHFMDHCGFLLEARGEPSRDETVAKHMLHAAQEKLGNSARKAGVELIREPSIEIPKEHLRLCLRKYGKNPATSYFASGRVYNHNRPRAGMHVHFGVQNQYTTVDDEGVEHTHNYTPLFNFSRIVWLMDRAFREEIKKAKRVPGEYELKPHGFEYRSLPNDIDVNKLCQVLADIRND